jgi:hypothetical protein
MFNGLRSENKTKQRVAATNLARELIESARDVSYADLSTATLHDELAQQPGLSDVSSTSNYLIARRGIDYQVDGTVCIMDDPADGAGPRNTADGSYCSDSATPGTTDKNPEDYKRVTITVSWQPNAGPRTSITQATVVNNPGSASGPAILTLTPNGFTLPVTTEPSSHTLNFQFTTNTKPTTANWLLDGSVQTPSPTVDSTGKVWSFAWNIQNVPDGTYLVAAEAFNFSGYSGPGRSLSVQLNRLVPKAPVLVYGGRSILQPNVVDLEWNAEADKDIVGYAVYRGSTIVCPMGQILSCTDTSAPNGTPTYTVYAYDYAPDGTLRAGPGTSISVSNSNHQPNTPTLFTGSVNAGGWYDLSWHRPSPDDPDNGDSVVLYRIYRDGQTVNERYDEWYSSSSTVSYRDSKPNGVQHTYWITAVDNHGAESVMAGPLTVGP